MHNKFLLFIDYLKKIFKEWFLWLFIIIDIVALIVAMIYQDLKMPNYIYLVLALIGFIYSGYRVYFETLKKIPSEEISEEISIKPEIKVSFVEGNSYEYSLESTTELIDGQSQKKYSLMHTSNDMMPKAKIVFNSRLENIGLIPVDVIAINLSKPDEEPYRFMVPHPFDVNDNPLTFPINLNLNDTFYFKFIDSIFPSSLLTNAQIGVQMKNIKRKNEKYPIVLSVEVASKKGDISTFEYTENISLYPLYDLIKSYWVEKNESELLRLLG